MNEGGLPRLFLNRILSFNNASLEELGVYTDIPRGFEQKDCVCIGRINDNLVTKPVIIPKKTDNLVTKSTLFSMIKNKKLLNTELIDLINKISLTENISEPIQDRFGFTLLCCAVAAENIELIKFLIIEKGVKEYNVTVPSLIMACEVGNEEIVNLLLDNQFDINVQETEDEKSALIVALQNNNDNIARLLIRRGIDVNLEDLSGYSALTYAKRFNKYDIIRLIKQSQNL